MKKIILNKTRYPHERLTLLNDGRGMGGAGKPKGHYSHAWQVACGRDTGHGYQGYMAVDYALDATATPWVSEDVRQNIRNALKAEGFVL